MINEETSNVYKRIFGDDKKYNFKFDYNQDKLKQEYLSYIYEWNGLSSSAKSPSSKKEYQNKARNWLNGRRTKQYGNDLYYDMISQTITVCYFCFYLFVIIHLKTIIYIIYSLLRFFQIKIIQIMVIQK